MGSQQPIGQHAARQAQKQLDKLEKLRPEAAAGNETAVHKFRVAARRLRSLLRLMKGLVPKRTLNPLRDDLAELASAFGEIRNLDVLTAHLEALTAHGPFADQFPEMAEAWSERRATSLARAEVMLNGEPYSVWYRRTHRFLEKLEDTETPPLREYLPVLAYQQLSAIRRHEGTLTTASPESLHRLRIEAKRLRYTLEFFSDHLGKPKPLIAICTAVQDALGVLNDLSVARHEVEPWSLEHPPYAVLLGQIEAAQHERRLSVPDQLDPLLSKEFRVGLGQALAEL